jgi:hypothetical protein
MFGNASSDDVLLPPRYLFDPTLVRTPQMGYVAKVRIDGKEYGSRPTDLIHGVHLIPLETEKGNRYVVVGTPVPLPSP